MIENNDVSSGSKLMRVQRDLGLAINLEENFTEVLKMCLTAALEISGMDCGGIYIVTPEEGLEMKTHFGLSEEFVEKVTYYDPESASAMLVKSGEAVYTNYKNLKVPKDDVRNKEGLEAIAIIPIPSKDGIIGGLNIASHKLIEVPNKARTALEVIANQIGGAIRRWKVDLQREELQKKYFEAQKMEAVGQLAAGIAHDFNNMLMGFMSFAEMIKDPSTPQEDLLEYAREIIKLARRGGNLTRQILVSARKGIGEQVVIDIEAQITDAVMFLIKTRMPKTIGIKREFHATYCKIRVDPGLIQMAILNLVINALHA
ncbi:GAF domain-containing protein, partial [Candidatus Woesearchaeota archaeon]|nr:GAF domain-containing protein [Candidatus Woesearchaeota archaeon]